MKKFTLSIILMFLFATLINAQVTTTVKVGGGINLSRLNTDNGNWSSDARLGYQFGGSWLLGDKLYLEPGIYWASIQSKMMHKELEDLNFDSKINMFRVPVFVGYHLLGNASESFFNLRVFGGPTMSIITSVTESLALERSDFSTVLWGVDAGVGVNIWWLFVDMGYEWGLNNVYSHENHGSAKAKGFWTNIGIRFNF